MILELENRGKDGNSKILMFLKIRNIRIRKYWKVLVSCFY